MTEAVFTKTTPQRRALFAAGLIGLAVALWSALGKPLPQLGEGAFAATVNGQIISMSEYARALEAVAIDSKDPLTETDKRRVLTTLIREELLVQKALDLNLHLSDRSVRKAIVTAALALAEPIAEVRDPDDDTLKDFATTRPDLTDSPAQYALNVVFLPRAALRFKEAETAIVDALKAGNTFHSLPTMFPDVTPINLPAGQLTSKELRTFLPQLVMAQLEDATAHDILGPIDSAEGSYFVWVTDATPRERQPFNDIRDALKIAWAAEQSRLAVGAYMETLEDGAVIAIEPSLFE